MSGIAIVYKGDAYNTRGKRLLGRQAAGEGFLKGLVQYGTQTDLYCYADEATDFQHFRAQIAPWMRRSFNLHGLTTNAPQQLAKPGLVFRPDSVISQMMWERRYADPRAYSICGITHSIASRPALEDLGNLLLAPIQPWDALICPSIAVKTVVEQLWDDWSDYLAQRTGGTIDRPIHLPVIPLGVDCAALAPRDAAVIRQRRRQEWGIGSNDMVALYMGRLSLSTKGHPVPMCMALERAAQATGASVCLLLVGWFESDMESALFRESVQRFCPSVNTFCLDGRSPDIRRDVWSTADLFISLVDNIQETFGLTPIEAMAAGLPAIVSDWNGYQTSVRHEIDGFRIPTLLPEPGTGQDLALAHLSDRMGYSEFVIHSALLATVDIEAATQALITLIRNPDVRRQMGANGRQHAQQTYDWSVVIAAYERLWQELAEYRAASPPIAPTGQPPYPLCADPMQRFAHYSSATLSGDRPLTLGQTEAKLLRQVNVTHITPERRAADTTVDAIVTTIQHKGPQTINALIQQYPQEDPVVLWRTIAYLLKFDVLRTIAP